MLENLNPHDDVEGGIVERQPAVQIGVDQRHARFELRGEAFDRGHVVRQGSEPRRKLASTRSEIEGATTSRVTRRKKGERDVVGVRISAWASKGEARAQGNARLFEDIRPRDGIHVARPG